MSYWLHLFETDLKEINGTAPSSIDLSKCMSYNSNDFVIGRGSPAYPVDVVVNARINNGSEIISRNHAKFVHSTEQGWRIEDLGAVNGIFVNRKRVINATLSHGDVVQLGGVSNVPVGEVLKETGLSIKYRVAFNQNETKSTKKAKRPATSTEGVLEKSSAKKIKSEDSAGLKEKDKAHAALNLVFAEKDKKITELQEQIKNSETAQSQLRTIASTLETACEHTTSEMREIKRESLDYKARYMEMKAKYESLASSFNEFRRNEEVALNTPACKITMSAMEVLMQCKICNGTIRDPVVLECSHGYCRTCIAKCEVHTCPACKAPFDTCPNTFICSAHLSAIADLVHDTVRN